MTKAMRGTAMIETAIVLSMVLVILYGVMQIAIWGYSQATTEGAAFVASHAASINSSGSQAADQTYGGTVASMAFPGVTSGNWSLSLTYPQTNVIQTIVSNNAITGLYMVPNAASTISVRGGDIEPILANKSDQIPTNSGFGVQAVLTNYCYWQNKSTSRCTARTMYLAQYDDIYGKGNGANGQFAEWNCRPGLFPTYGTNGSYFPAAYPAGGYNSIYDPASSNFGTGYTEASLYSFDTQTSKWGTQSSC